jgi:hypothetical protein
MSITVKNARDIDPVAITHRVPVQSGSVIVYEVRDGWVWARCDAAGRVVAQSGDIHGAPWTCLDDSLVHTLPLVHGEKNA